MEQKETFKMTYSARQQEEIQSIRRKYMPQTESKLERLRALDDAVNKKATLTAISVGLCGALLMGLGMSLVMTEFGAALGALALPVGIAAGLAGMVLVALAYPLFRRTLRRERAKAAPEILRLADKLMR